MTKYNFKNNSSSCAIDQSSLFPLNEMNQVKNVVLIFRRQKKKNNIFFCQNLKDKLNEQPLKHCGDKFLFSFLKNFLLLSYFIFHILCFCRFFFLLCVHCFAIVTDITFYYRILQLCALWHMALLHNCSYGSFHLKIENICFFFFYLFRIYVLTEKLQNSKKHNLNHLNFSIGLWLSWNTSAESQNGCITLGRVKKKINKTKLSI